MPFRRRRLPPELLDALRAADAAARPRWRDRLRRLPMAGLFLLLALAAVAAVEFGPPWRALVPGGFGPALPRLVQGIPDGTAATGAPASGHFTARVAAIDGDTLVMGDERLRIEGIDAPEMNQACRRRGADYACGAEARRAMAAILGRAVVSCQALGTDIYGRRLVRCHNEAGADIGAELVRQGWAVAFTRYSTAYVGQEAQARAARRGLWEGSFEVPAEWRTRQRP